MSVKGVSTGPDAGGSSVEEICGVGHSVPQAANAVEVPLPGVALGDPARLQGALHRSSSCRFAPGGRGRRRAGQFDAGVPALALHQRWSCFGPLVSRLLSLWIVITVLADVAECELPFCSMLGVP